jgi:hypothetical protein
VLDRFHRLASVLARLSDRHDRKKRRDDRSD